MLNRCFHITHKLLYRGGRSLKNVRTRLVILLLSLTILDTYLDLGNEDGRMNIE